MLIKGNKLISDDSGKYEIFIEDILNNRIRIHIQGELEPDYWTMGKWLSQSIVNDWNNFHYQFISIFDNVENWTQYSNRLCTKLERLRHFNMSITVMARDEPLDMPSEIFMK